MKLQRNKRVITLFYAMIVTLVPVVFSGCTNSSHKKVSPKEQQVNESLEQEYYQEFEKYGFAIKTPCELKDVSSQSSGDFLLNYGGVTDQHDSKKMAAYQLIVSRVPVGYKDYSKSDYEVIVKEVIKNKVAHFTSSKPIRFGYEGYVGYEGTTLVGGYKQKGVIFAKGNLIIALTVITNNRLQSKFNKFTNGFKVLSSKTYDEPLAKSTRKKAAIPLAFGYSVDAPCRLSVTSIAGMDYAYSGAINGDDRDRAVIYKVQANELPQAYSSMLSSDKRTIKSNLLNYLEQRGRYTQASVNVEAHFAYSVDFMEHGFKCKECLILTDRHVIELIMFSKKDISSDFSSFVNSLNEQ